MRKYLVTLIFLALASLASAQIYSYNKEVNAVLKAILKSQKRPYKLSPYTRNAAFKITHFREPQHHSLDPNPIPVLCSAEWKGFLNSIDTAKISDYKLNTRFIEKQNLRSKSSRKTLLTFSSPIFSNDLNLSIFYLDDFSSGLSASGDIYYLEKRGRKWVVITRVMIYIS